MNATAGDCDEGFYCAGNASEASPTDGTTGTIVLRIILSSHITA